MRVAILRPGALGDVIAVRAIAGFLRAMGEEVEIALWASGARGELLAQCGVVDKAFDLDSAESAWLFGGDGAPPLRLAAALAGCDFAFAYFEDGDGGVRRRLQVLGCADVHFHRGRPAEDGDIHIHDHLLLPLRAVFGTPPVGYRPLPLRVPRSRIATALAKWALAEPYAVIHPGSGSKKKNWPYFAELGVRLARRGLRLAIAAGEAESDLGARLQKAIAERSAHAPVLIRTELLEVAAILAKAAFYIGNDSGISHLAAAAEPAADTAAVSPGREGRSRRPCIVIFGPTSPRVWAPPAATIVAAPAGQLKALAAEEVFAACEPFLQSY